jgi:hypothetical protein
VTVVKNSATAISDDITMADIPRKYSKVSGGDKARPTWALARARPNYFWYCRGYFKAKLKFLWINLGKN